MNSSLFLGSFDAEKFWKHTSEASLPSFHDIQSDAIVETMDEIQFVFCQNEDDFLVSSFAMNPVHKNYLHELGFRFITNGKDIKKDTADDRSIFEVLISNNVEEIFYGQKNNPCLISPYAVLPFTSAFCSRFGVKDNFPSIDVIKKVSSKVFSSQVGLCFSQDHSCIINSTEELELQGEEMLSKSAIILKDPLGVSGKGNLYIGKIGLLKRIIKYLKKQENEGKKIQFILENYLEKKSDFSCQFFIEENGISQVISVQQMENKRFGFNSIHKAPASLTDFLERKKYFLQVERVSKLLFEEGYHGPVCLDSMLLKNEDIVPVVEINARKSMGLVNYYVDKFLSQFSVQGHLMTLSFIMERPVSFEKFFIELQEQNILFTKDNPFGIMPVSANSFDINIKKSNNYPTKGRLYITLVKGSDETPVISKLHQVFSDMGIKLLP